MPSTDTGPIGQCARCGEPLYSTGPIYWSPSLETFHVGCALLHAEALALSLQHRAL